MWWGKCFAPLIPFTPKKVVNWSKFVVGPALPLSTTSTFTPPYKHPQGANISRGKWEGQIIFLGVNIYPYHPNSAKSFMEIKLFSHMMMYYPFSLLINTLLDK
jgi:hypothetical protein